MTFCRHNEGRIVPITYKQSDDLSDIPAGRFYMCLVKNGSITFIINGERCYISGKTVLFFDDEVNFKLLASHNLDASSVSFAPQFINVDLNWETIRSPQYPDLRALQNYPDFDLFLNRNAMYNGILPLEDDLFLIVEKYFNSISGQVLQQPDNQWSCRSRAYIFEIFGLLRLFLYEYTHQEEADRIALQVCNYISININREINIDSLCKIFATNRTTLARKFKEFTGNTISNYIVLKRIENAKYLLGFTSLYLDEVARQCGFNEQSYFTKIFKNKTGMAPLEYRKLMRKNRRIKK